MAAELVTRDKLRRELMLNAARKPLPIGVGVAVVVAAFALGASWLLPVAILIYLALAASTFFDGDEAERVGQRVYARARTGPVASLGAPRALPEGLTPELVALLERARTEERRILETIAGSELPFEQISTEVEGLAAEMERIAGRAQSVSAFLEAHDPDELRRRLLDLLAADQSEGAAADARERAAAAVQDQLRVGEALESELQRFRAEMEHLIASLGVIHGQLVRISVSFDPQLQEDVAREVRDLRTRVGTMAEGLRAATDEVQDRA